MFIARAQKRFCRSFWSKVLRQRFSDLDFLWHRCISTTEWC